MWRRVKKWDKMGRHDFTVLPYIKKYHRTWGYLVTISLTVKGSTVLVTILVWFSLIPIFIAPWCPWHPKPCSLQMKICCSHPPGARLISSHCCLNRINCCIIQRLKQAIQDLYFCFCQPNNKTRTKTLSTITKVGFWSHSIPYLRIRHFLKQDPLKQVCMF